MKKILIALGIIGVGYFSYGAIDDHLEIGRKAEYIRNSALNGEIPAFSVSSRKDIDEIGKAYKKAFEDIEAQPVDNNMWLSIREAGEKQGLVVLSDQKREAIPYK